MIGRNESSSLSTSSKQFYIGRIGKKEDIDSVEKFLDKQLKNIKVGEKVNDVTFSNLKELNTDRLSFLSISWIKKSLITRKSGPCTRLSINTSYQKQNGLKYPKNSPRNRIKKVLKNEPSSIKFKSCCYFVVKKR